MAKGLCVFCGYLNAQRVPEYVFVYARELRRHHDRMIFVSNEDHSLDERDRRRFEQLEIELLRVANEGYDFGMWMKALGHVDARSYDWLTLVNDSCVLLRRLDDFFGWAFREGQRYCGLLDSHERRHHIQSYLLCLSSVARDVLFQSFRSHGLAATREDAIATYEIGLSDLMRRHEVPVESFYRVRADYGANALIKEWPTLLAKGFPLVKRRYVSCDLEVLALRSYYKRWGHLPSPAEAARLIDRHLPRESWLDPQLPEILERIPEKPHGIPASTLWRWKWDHYRRLLRGVSIPPLLDGAVGRT